MMTWENIQEVYMNQRGWEEAPGREPGSKTKGPIPSVQPLVLALPTGAGTRNLSQKEGPRDIRVKSKVPMRSLEATPKGCRAL
jgi:hypothetical protein